MAAAEEEVTVSGASFRDSKAWDNINILSSGVYTFDQGPHRTVTVQGLPPAPVVWTYNAVDLVCDVVGCENWRSHLNLEDDSWWSEGYRVPPVRQLFPELPSFADFRNQQQQQHSSTTSTADALYRYAFHTPSTALGDLTTPTAWAALFVLCWVWRKIKAVVMPAACATGRRLAQRTHGDAWVKAADNQVRIAKFGEYVVRLCYHSAISVYGLVYFFYGGTSEWWQAGKTRAVFAGYPHHEILPGMAWYYLLQAAYNLDAFWTLLELSFVVRIRSPVRAGKHQEWQAPIAIEWSPTVRGDFKEMMVHHVVTNLLIFGSSLYRITRVGSMVFLVHDISDVPVDLSKLANFLKYKWTTISCFTVLTLTWMYTRLTILPFTIFRCVITESHYLLEEGSIPPIAFIAYKHFFYVLTALLILLHLAWFVMFLRMYHTFFIKKEGCHDLSEHKQGEAPVELSPTNDDESCLEEDSSKKVR